MGREPNLPRHQAISERDASDRQVRWREIIKHEVFDFEESQSESTPQIAVCFMKFQKNRYIWPTRIKSIQLHL